MDRTAMIEKARQMIEQTDDLPTIPAVATRILALLDKPDVEIEEVADLMLADQVMAARVLKLINSPVYKPSHEITTLKRALVHLGLRHIREVVLTTSLIKIFGAGTGAHEVNAFWEHSFGVGMVSKIIAQKVGYPDLDKAYISGIIHDIGEVFLSSHLPDDFRQLQESIKGTSIGLLEAEELLLETTHAEIGLCLAQKWNFPEAYREVIACHHAPGDAKADRVLCAIVNLADLFWSVRGLHYCGWVSFNLSEEPAWNILSYMSPNFAELDEERFSYELDDAVASVKELVVSIFQS
jgi:putative nucleotidyltransferase with HDIG domain